jgi:hypothetical protein
MRSSEWVLAGYFAYTSLLALILPRQTSVAAVTIALNLTILTTCAKDHVTWLNEYPAGSSESQRPVGGAYMIVSPEELSWNGF